MVGALVAAIMVVDSTDERNGFGKCSSRCVVA